MPKDVSQEQVQYWIVSGLKSEEASDFDTAIECFEQALGLNPRDAGVWNSLGWIWYRKGNPDKALSCFERAITEDKNCCMAYVNMGIVLKNLGEYEEALNWYKKAMEIADADPHDAKRAWYNMANLYYERRELGDLLEAKRCVNRALQLDPSYPHALRLLRSL